MTGNPSDATVLTSVSGFTANVDTNTFNRYSISPVTLLVGSRFFAGAIYRELGAQVPASIEKGLHTFEGSVPGNFILRGALIHKGFCGNITSCVYLLLLPPGFPYPYCRFQSLQRKLLTDLSK